MSQKMFWKLIFFSRPIIIFSKMYLKYIWSDENISSILKAAEKFIRYHRLIIIA